MPLNQLVQILGCRQIFRSMFVFFYRITKTDQAGSQVVGGLKKLLLY